MKVHVRQYRPNFVTGFENEVCRDVEEADILQCPWFDSFRRDGFVKFTIEPYHDEKIISAHYDDGKSWVAAFAVPIDHPLANDWRYRPQR
jgi:hypothetical protein